LPYALREPGKFLPKRPVKSQFPDVH